jgi:hypothetical protein
MKNRTSLIFELGNMKALMIEANNGSVVGLEL